jgi:hypothetical protein
MGGKLTGRVKGRSEDIGPAERSVFPIELEPGLLVEGDQRSGVYPQLGLVGLDDIEGSQPVATFELDQGAVGAAELSRQGPE